MSLMSEYLFSVDWLEDGEQGRKESFARQFQFSAESEARAVWTRSCRLEWVEPHQHSPSVSDLYRLDYDVEDGRRSKMRSRKVIAEVPMQRRSAA